MSEKIIDEINEIKTHSEKIYNCFVYPTYKLGKTQRIEFLKILKNDLENLSRILGTLSGYATIQYSREIESDKIKLFQSKINTHSQNLQKQIFFEEHFKDIDNDLVNIKKEITLPEIYFNIEQTIKNELNNLILYLENIQKQINYRYTNIFNKKKSVDELLVLLDKKEETIKELNKKIEDLKYVDAKEKTKESRIISLEEELLKSYKISEQDLTIFKIQVIHIERALNEITKQTKQLTNDINRLESKTIVKEQMSLDLIRELKKENYANKYLLIKK